MNSTDLNITDEVFFKIKDDFSLKAKELEKNFKNQIVILILYFTYLTGSITENPTFLGVNINVEILSSIFPIALMYLLSKMAVNLVLFVELGEHFFNSINKNGRNIDLYRTFRPITIFLSIFLTNYSLGKKNVKKIFNKLMSILLFTFPGLNIAITVLSVSNITNRVLEISLYIVIAVLGIGIFYEYISGIYTKKYKYVIYTMYISAILIYPLLVNYLGK